MFERFKRKRKSKKCKCVCVPSEPQYSVKFHYKGSDYYSEPTFSGGGGYQLTDFVAPIPEGSTQFELFAFVELNNGTSFTNPETKVEFDISQPTSLVYELLCSQGVNQSGVIKNINDYQNSAIFNPNVPISNLHCVKVTGLINNAGGNISFGYGGLSGYGNYILKENSYIKFS